MPQKAPRPRGSLESQRTTGLEEFSQLLPSLLIDQRQIQNKTTIRYRLPGRTSSSPGSETSVIGSQDALSVDLSMYTEVTLRGTISAKALKNTMVGEHRIAIKHHWMPHGGLDLTSSSTSGDPFASHLEQHARARHGRR
jgi:hypothetical protein